MLVTVFGPSWFNSLQLAFREWLAIAFRPSLDSADAVTLMQNMAGTALLPLAFASGTLFLVGTASQLMLTKGAVSLELLAFKADRLNPVNRLRQMFSENLFNALYAVLLFSLTSFMLWTVVRDQVANFVITARAPIQVAISGMFEVIRGLLWQIVGLAVLIGCIDLFRKYRKHHEGLRMTKQEVKDEMKESEGRPEVKQRIRSIQRNMLRRQMMNAVPTATVVVVNPTHYAVALKYELDGMAAPVVVAKGKNFLAQRIRDRARENGVLIVENVMVARALYKSVHVGQEIPPQLYRAVAEVLAYVYEVMERKLR
jgi:flagellar biosynthetic protein FlhB